MPNKPTPQLPDVATLTQALETVFRKLIRYLIGRISLVKLQEMIRVIFIEEAENSLRKTAPEKSVSLTQLALLSGIDTRTLIKVKNSDNFRKPFHTANSFLKEFTPGSSLLDAWNSKPPYFDTERKRAKRLSISGGDCSFESLFSESVKSRGVTSSSLLRRLVDSGSVSLNEKSGSVSLVRSSYMPSATEDELGAVAVGFSAIGSLIDSVVHNLAFCPADPGPLYQRGIWSFRIPNLRKEDVRIEMAQSLEKSRIRARNALLKFEESRPDANQFTAGVGLFYFEE